MWGRSVIANTKMYRCTSGCQQRCVIYIRKHIQVLVVICRDRNKQDSANKSSKLSTAFLEKLQLISMHMDRALDYTAVTSLRIST